MTEQELIEIDKANEAFFMALAKNVAFSVLFTFAALAVLVIVAPETHGLPVSGAMVAGWVIGCIGERLTRPQKCEEIR